MAMASPNQSLLDKPNKSISKTIWLLLSLSALFSSALFASYLFSPTSFIFNLSHPHHHLCDHALHKSSCLAHLSELTQASTFTTSNDLNSKLLHSLLTKTTSQIQKTLDSTKAIKYRINDPKQQQALQVCEQLLELSLDRVWDSMVALTEKTTKSNQDAHTWLSTVLTNHVTCLDEVEGSARALIESDLNDLVSRARTSLALLVHVMPSKIDVVDEQLNGEFPSWITSKDRKLLEAPSNDIKANVVVAKDGSGRFKTVGEAVASAPDNSKTRYVIYVKKGVYKENVEIGSTKKNVMLVGDGMDSTIITGSLNFVDGTPTFKTATVGMDPKTSVVSFHHLHCFY
ncbi:hypothetical protein QN277_005350 [Acacia crassicarpa]|uniref:Pectinesterase n=1 Tax=Acacia crassicarpa TaxID=499986 RepID=A0AAE1IXU3_9FABA|nr:hypothetical protein QN277_005350 [Acacia crassicarpa]